MNEQRYTQQLLEALQKTQAILGSRTLDELKGCLRAVVDQYGANEKLIGMWKPGMVETKLPINLSCDWLDNPIRTGIKKKGKEYILSGYYQDANGNKHFTHQEAIEIAERTPGWKLCMDEFHKALARAVWDDNLCKWKKNVCGTKMNGYEYMTQFLKYELGGYRDNASGALTNVGSYGCSWSSSVSNTFGMCLYFSPTYLHPSYASSRADGLQVRCLQE